MNKMNNLKKSKVKPAQSETIRMFENNFLESLTHVHPSVPFILYVPLVIFCVVVSFEWQKLGGLQILTWFAAGFFLWTLAEYILHRFLFHPPFKETYTKKLYFFIHGIHHDAPNDATRLVMPPGASIPLAIAFYFLFRSVVPDVHLPLFAGFVTGYMVYDFIHFATHFFAWNFQWFTTLKSNHMQHHFQNSDKNFGVSSPIWDYLFFTKYNARKHVAKQPIR